MERAKFTGVEEDESPEVLYLLKNIKIDELLPKARDAVNLFFLNIKTNPQADTITEASLLRPIWRAIAKKEDLIEQGGLKSVVALLSSQTVALQTIAAKSISSLASDGQEKIVDSIRALNVHITAVKLISSPISHDLLLRLLELIHNLAKVDSCRLPLIRIRTVACVVSLLESSSKPPESSEISALAEAEATLDIISKERGLDLSVSSISSSDFPVRLQALNVIKGFAKDGKKGRGHLAKTNLPIIFAQLLQDKNRPLDAKLQRKVVSIIANMAEDLLCSTQLESVGIVKILALLVFHGGPIQEKALKAILNFSVHDTIKLSILQTGVVPKLSLLSLSPQTRILAISVLNNLATEATFLKEMPVKGIVELVNSMPAAPVLVQRIIARIVKSAARFDEVKNGLLEFGAVSIFTGMMNQTKDDFVLAEIIDVLAILTKHERIRKVVIACGHTVRIVSLLGSHLFERLELPIVTVISNLTKENEGVAAVSRLNGAFRVFSKMAIWHENKELRASAMMAVANLMVNDMNRTEFVAMGGLDAALYLSIFYYFLIHLFDIHNYLIYETDEDLKTSAVSVLAKLAKSVEFQEKLLEQDIIEHLKELKKQPSFVTPKAGSPLIAAFKELVMALKANGASGSISIKLFYKEIYLYVSSFTFTLIKNYSNNGYEFWIYLRKGDYVRALKVNTEELLPMVKTAFKIPENDSISLMFKDAGYPVVLHSSDELLLFFMNYQDNKRLPLIVYEGEVPEADIMIEKPAIPPPPAPPPPPPGALDRIKRDISFSAPVYLQHAQQTKMTSKPQNALLPENLMSDILSAVKKRGEGVPLLQGAPINRRGDGTTTTLNSSFEGSPINRANKSEETMGERDWFRHVGKWYKRVHQIFTMHPILVRVIFDIVDSRQDHKSFTKCYDTTVTNLPHILPHMQHAFSQDELAECLLRVGFNVKSSKSGGETIYEFIVRPTSLSPELLLKAILLFTNKN